MQPSLLTLLLEDVDTILASDPAAKSRLEVVLCYAGLHALWLHRIIHPLWRAGFRLPCRVFSQMARFCTGIEIHPAAAIGRRLFIDHGMGVVIGETTVIGNDVTLYQGVTLGGTGKDKTTKRHPTLEDHVVVGSGGKILGNITIGARAHVGANAVVLSDVPADATVVGVPGRIVSIGGKRTDSVRLREALSQRLQSLERHSKQMRLELKSLNDSLTAGEQGYSGEGI